MLDEQYSSAQCSHTAGWQRWLAEVVGRGGWQRWLAEWMATTQTEFHYHLATHKPPDDTDEAITQHQQINTAESFCVLH